MGKMRGRLLSCCLQRKSCFTRVNRLSLISTLKHQKRYSMQLSKVVKTLEEFAPLTLAEGWDNVGLLIEPSKDKEISNVLLCIDLTEPVLKEALDHKTDLIISYHPPLFRSFKRLTQKDVKTRIAIKCIEERVAVFSPHTTWDCVKGGVNFWLADAFKGSIQESKPITPHPDLEDTGMGRFVTLKEETSLDEIVKHIKKHVDLPHIRLAKGSKDKIKTIAICAGSGAELFNGVKADLYWTGELSHHIVLGYTAMGASVILCDHSNTERGYLKEFKPKLEEMLTKAGAKKVNVVISKIDADPLVVV